MALNVERVSVAGSWWRQVPHGTDPLLLPSPPSSGRWQRGTSVAAIYLADDEATAWAEWYRERLYREGCHGVLYPSAARPDHRALCLFREGVLVPGAEPVRPPTTYRDLPAPPQGLHT